MKLRKLRKLRVTPCPGLLVDDAPVEIVERKGLGHPDTICDALAEQLSITLSRLYVERCDTVLHHNVDKVLLAGGSSAPGFGGGRILAPIEIFLAGRAVSEVGAERLEIEDLAVETSRAWLREHLPALDLEAGVEIHSLVRPGSSELVHLFERHRDQEAARLANDTSIGVGHAPRSRLEKAVLALEGHLNSSACKQEHPHLGADVKVMGVREGEAVRFTVACAFVDRHVESFADYCDKRVELEQLVRERVGSIFSGGDGDVAVAVNSGDDLENEQVYLTVTGTSAESGDDGEAGRGNRAGGLITPCRPMTMESCAGKNPITHVGKLYNLLAPRIAEAVVDLVPDVAAAHCYLVSRIGHPISDPQLVHVEVQSRATGHRLEAAIGDIVAEHLGGLDRLWREILEGKLVVY